MTFDVAINQKAFSKGRWDKDPGSKAVKRLPSSQLLLDDQQTDQTPCGTFLFPFFW